MFKVKIGFKSGEDVVFEVKDFDYKIIDGIIQKVDFEFDDIEKKGVFINTKEIAFLQYWDTEEEDKKALERMNAYMLEAAKAKNYVMELVNELQFYANGGNDGGLRAKHWVEHYRRTPWNTNKTKV